MTLTKYEKETIILFNEGEDTAHIQTYNAGLRKRLAAFSKKHPDLCRLEKSFAQGGVIYVLDKSRLSIRLQAPYSEERRRKASENAKKRGLNSRNNSTTNLWAGQYITTYQDNLEFYCRMCYTNILFTLQL